MNLFDEYPSYEFEESIEACHELSQGIYKLNAALQINNILALESSDYSVIMEGKVGDFFNSVKERIKSFWEKVKSFFASVFKRVDLFVSQSKTFLDKYGNSIQNAINSGKCEWVTYNDKYIMSSEEDKMLDKIDSFVNDIVKYVTDIENAGKKMLTTQNNNRQPNEARSSEISKQSDDAFVKEIENVGNNDNNKNENVPTGDLAGYEKKIANKFNSQCNTFEEVLADFRKVVKAEKKDTESMLDQSSANYILKYVKEHVSEDMTKFKNAQKQTDTNIKQALAAIDRIQNMTRNLENTNKVLTDLTGNITKALTTCQSINSDRISARTKTFNYYMNIIRAFAKKNAKLITKGESVNSDNNEETNTEERNKTEESNKKDNKKPWNEDK